VVALLDCGYGAEVLGDFMEAFFART
jgi:hypothetical protein